MGWLDNLFVVIIAVVVMLAIQWVGLLIINAMLILPAAAARNVAGSMRSYHLLALIFGLFSRRPWPFSLLLQRRGRWPHHRAGGRRPLLRHLPAAG